jgi:hypothetical protein
MQTDEHTSPVAWAIKILTGLLSGMVGLVYVTLGGIATLSIVGFIFALLIA